MTVGKRLFAWVYARTEGRLRQQSATLRAGLVGDLEGQVLEIGCGTGANFAYYPAAAHVTATDYNAHMLRRAVDERGSAAATIELRQADIEALPFDDDSFDSVVSALVLCSVADQPRALAEMRRVLKPGGALRLFEHVRSDRRWVARLQQVGTPAWSFVAGGCHLNRDTVAAVVAAGFEIEREDTPSLPAIPLKHLVVFARRPAA